MNKLFGIQSSVIDYSKIKKYFPKLVIFTFISKLLGPIDEAANGNDATQEERSGKEWKRQKDDCEIIKLREDAHLIRQRGNDRGHRERRKLEF